MQRPARQLLLAAGAVALAIAAGPLAANPNAADEAALQAIRQRVNGFVVWESNRTGNWELYRIDSDGSGPKQLTHLVRSEDPLAYDDYLRPRVSPDGKTILFAYGKKRRPAEVWIVPSEGGEARRLTVGNPLSWASGGKEILFVRSQQIWRHSLAGGTESLVHPVKVPVDGQDGSMVGDARPDLKAAVFRTPESNEYFVFDTGKTVKKTAGCEPGFSADGRYLYWVQGPKDFRIWDIAKDEERQLLAQPDYDRWNYTYFPTISDDGRWLAYGASPEQHDHSTSDYEVFLQELKDWQPVGKPVRLSWHPRTDRWPFLWVRRS